MLIYFIILLAVVSRFVPHIPNFAPITALAIFAAANMDWKKATGIVLAARFISDIFIGFVSWPMMVAIYASHLVGVLFGVWIKNATPLALRAPSPQDGRELQPAIFPSPFKERARERLQINRWFKIIASSLGASAIFFLVTNFAFLYSNYAHNFSGILESYANGLPFLRGTLFGDLSYTMALFGSLALARYLLAAKVLFKSPKSILN